ncbi:MAG: hypothetical protein WC860_07055 [Candidatus Margulisiibacteriota bacterium]|jgi:hypothetical protein
MFKNKLISLVLVGLMLLSLVPSAFSMGFTPKQTVNEQICVLQARIARNNTFIADPAVDATYKALYTSANVRINQTIDYIKTLDAMKTYECGGNQKVGKLVDTCHYGTNPECVNA